MKIEEIKELSFSDLRVKCKEFGISFVPKDTTAVLVQKLTDYFNEKNEVKKTEAKVKKKTSASLVKIIVTKRDPSDDKDSLVIPFLNEFIDKTFYIPFDMEVKVPKFVAKNIEGLEFQDFVKVKWKFGMRDQPRIKKAYRVEYI